MPDTKKASEVLPPPAPPISVKSPDATSDSKPAAKSSTGSATTPAPAAAPKEKEEKEEPEEAELDVNKPDPKVIDMQTLGQLLEMDEGPDHEFSRSLVEEYFEQAAGTMKEIEGELENEDKKKTARLEILSSKAHFLKGSSATLGVANVRDTCETLQHLGKCKDETGANPLSETEAWDKTIELMPTLKDDLHQATRWLKALCNIEDAVPGADSGSKPSS